MWGTAGARLLFGYWTASRFCDLKVETALNSHFGRRSATSPLFIQSPAFLSNRRAGSRINKIFRHFLSANHNLAYDLFRIAERNGGGDG